MTIGCSAGYIGYVLRYGVSAVFWDSWGYSTFLHAHGFTLSTLWAQHNEDRNFFPNIVAYVVIEATRWNDVAVMLVSAGFMIGSLATIISALKADIRKKPLLWLPVPFVVLMLAQYQNTLWSFQIAWPFALFFILVSLRLLMTEEISWPVLLGALALAAIASYSLLQGLLVWPAGAVLLSRARLGPRLLGIWVAVGVACSTLYFVGFDFSATHSASVPYLLRHFGSVVKGLLISTGSVLPHAGFGVTETIGAALLVAGVGIVVVWVRSGRPGGGRAFCVALVVIGTLFELLLLPGRTAATPSYGAQSRYVTFTWLLLLGVYGYLATATHWRNGLDRMAQVSVTALVVATVIVGSVVGINEGHTTRTIRLTSVDVLANIQHAQPFILAPYVNPPCLTEPPFCKQTRRAARYLEKQRENIFSNPDQVRRLRRLGIVPGGQPTQLLPVPSSLRSQVASNHQAWTVLSAVYWTEPALQRQFGPDISRLIAWAAKTGDSLSWQAELEAEFNPPVGASFFLEPYTTSYQDWEGMLSSSG